MRYMMILCLLMSCSGDGYQWLEKVEGKKALEFAKSENKKTFDYFQKHESYNLFLDEAQKLLTANDRIPYGTTHGYFYYNFWQDQDHVRGILRRASLDGLQKKKTYWDLVLDLDKLAKDEKENWVYKGIEWFRPYNGRCLIHLSRGGKDATVIREFDVKEKKFVKDGFYLPEAKSDVSWYDRDTLIIGTNFGEGSLTTSGYPRVVKLLKRGQKLEQAELIFEGDLDDVSSRAFRDLTEKDGLTIISKNKSFYSASYWKMSDDKKLEKLNIPHDADFTMYKGYFIIHLKSGWELRYKQKIKVLPMGALVAVKYEDINSPQLIEKAQVVLEPSLKMTIGNFKAGRKYLFVSVMDNVVGSIWRFELRNGKWRGVSLGLPENGSARMVSFDPIADRLFIRYENFTTPTSLYMYNGVLDMLEKIKSMPAKFDASELEVTQVEVASKDGTPVPYFLVSQKGMKYDGSNPTLLYGYGGFEHAMTPFYSSTIGRLWLERGGNFVLSNIRGGGEFGPRWHQAALKKNRPKAYEDFEAIAEDLISKKITSSKNLGIMGGSNGGLLVGAAFTRRPELYNAVVCQVPLLDMLRYHKLLAGASWMAEYGDPDKESDRKFLLSYSPYHNVKKEVHYPEVLFMTSTKDDRVHPGHARKMVAKMRDMGHSLFYYENTEGGHGGSANLVQRAKWYALEFAYLWDKLGTPKPFVTEKEEMLEKATDENIEKKETLEENADEASSIEVTPSADQ